MKRPSFAAAVEAMDGGDAAAAKTKLATALQEVSSLPPQGLLVAPPRPRTDCALPVRSQPPCPCTWPSNPRAVAQAFAQTDAELIESCKADKVLDYVSSTGVVAVFMGKILSIAHVGDSRVAVGHMVDGSLRGGNMTIDHKPDKPAELRRIEAVRRDGIAYCATIPSC